MSNLSQLRKKSDDISTYIQKQLSTLLKQVKQTPPKKNTSLKKIQKIIQKSNISKSDKQQISKSIKRVQSAISRSSSVQRIKDKLTKQPTSGIKYEKNLFYQKMILQQKELNLKTNQKQQNNQLKIKQSSPYSQRKPANRFIQLIQTFQQLRTRRLKYQHQIQSLSIKAQKLQRLIQIKRQNQQKYLQSVQISQKYNKKKQKLQQMKNEIKNAAKQNRKKVISVLMKKYSKIQEG